MDNVILTRNVFIAHAFRKVLTKYRCKNICVVDIDSYHSLHEILQVMKNANLNQDHKLFCNVPGNSSSQDFSGS